MQPPLAFLALFKQSIYPGRHVLWVPALSALIEKTLLFGSVSQRGLQSLGIPFLSIFLANTPAAITILCFPVSFPSASLSHPPDAVQAGQKPPPSV